MRSAINQQGTRAQHEAYYAMVRSSCTGLPVVILGDGGMAQVGFSNWSKAGLFDLDFAPTRKNSGNNKEPCRPSYMQANHGPVKPTDGFFILGKDSDGNYWASAFKVKGSWNKFQKHLNKAFET